MERTLSLRCWLILSIAFFSTNADNLPTCLPKDFHYEYTECDSMGGRWRVSVPKPNKCIGGAPNPPIRGKDCKFTCPEGHFLDINGDQKCQSCPAGTYSLGGGVRYDNFDHMPMGFSATAQEFLGGFNNFIASSVGKPQSDSGNCTRSWVVSKGNLASFASSCRHSLTFSANLVKAGAVTFSYQLTDPDTVFHFSVQNDQCQTVNDKSGSQWLDTTEKGDWQPVTVSLKSGVNILEWKTVGTTDGHRKAANPSPVLIRSIEISGVAYSSECTRCRAGTFSKPGSTSCEQCPENTYSGPGAAGCMKCNPTIEFSAAGSANCTKRHPCSAEDYFEYNTPCDTQKMSQKMSKWIEPKICREDLPGAVKLPPPGKKEPCPPCNPGMMFKNGSCVFCGKDSFSLNGTACRVCPVSTAPNYEIDYKWWNAVPPNVTTSCLSIHERGCVTKGGWQPEGDHITTGRGHSNDVYLLLSLKVGGFRGNGGSYKDETVTVGKLSFVFELDCKGSCKFYFMQQSLSHGTSVITSWNGKQAKQKYVHELKSTEMVSFSWAFQKENWQDTSGDDNMFTMKNDLAKIYSIHVTNTLTGGASSCTKCPKGTSHDGCIPCPDGHYIDPNTTQCVECPPNTVVHGTNPWGVALCHSCGEGLTAVDHKYCTSNCHFHSAAGKHYDFSKLKGLRTVQGNRLFTSTGTQYYHLFNISLCGEMAMKPMCVNNITAEARSRKTNHTATHKSAKRLQATKELGLDSSDYVHALICRSTIVPPVGDLFSGRVVSAQPVSLADSLQRVTSDSESLNMSKRMTDEGFDVDNDNLDVHFVYSSNVPTQACPKGRSTIITLRCDIAEKGTGAIDIPPKCADGTCDGCNFHFMWRSQQGCPVCKKDEYQVLQGECTSGVRTIHYIPPKHCLLLENSKPMIKKVKCPDLNFWLSVAAILLGFCGTLMCALLCYCYKKNQKLEYKYCRLIENSSGKDGELPSAETCALDEDEEEQFDSVQFKESRGKKFFKKFKTIGKKDDNPFETIQLTDKTLDL